MDNDGKFQPVSSELHRLAKEQMCSEQMTVGGSPSNGESVRQTHELQIQLIELKLQNEKLRQTIEEREKLLIHQGRQAAMGEMIGNIAHQWRQPLNALGLTIQQLQMFYDIGELTGEVLEQCVGNSMALIEHMSRTMNDFMNFFRPDKEKVEFQVAEAIAHTLSLFGDSFKNQLIRIEIVATDDPVIFGYPNEFVQVLHNILNNARDVLTEREISDPTVTITLRAAHGRVVVTIADNAGGIPEEIMDKIFDPYFTTKEHRAGTGVGLFMSKGIIEKNMGGRLAVRNTADGAEFVIEV